MARNFVSSFHQWDGLQAGGLLGGCNDWQQLDYQRQAGLLAGELQASFSYRRAKINSVNALEDEQACSFFGCNL